MNTLQDLRDTLDAHAAGIPDDASVARTSAVRRRARALRRRRTAAVGAAAVLAIVGASVVPLLGGDHTPIPGDRELIGKVAPATLSSLGYTYHFVEGVEGGENPASIRLRPADGPRLITWAADADHVRVDADVESYATRSRHSDFDDFVFVPAAESTRLTIRAGGADAAIAVYELGDERPAGYTVDGMTFREQVADEQLLGAGIGKEGDAEVTFDLFLPPRHVRFTGLCRGEIPKGYWFNVEVGDEGRFSTSGCTDDGFDPGVGNGGAFFVLPGEAGDRVTARAWVSRRPEGEAVAIDDARIGAAVYDVGDPAGVVAGHDVPWLMEDGGKLWRFSSSHTAHFTGSERTTATNSRREPVLVAGYFQGVGPRTTIRFWNGNSATDFSGGGSGGPLTAVLQHGGSARMVVDSGSRSAKMGFATYERAD